MDCTIGTENIPTPLKAEALNSIIQQLLTYKVKIATIQEIIWTGGEEIWDRKLHTLLSSGKMKSDGNIAFIVDVSERVNILKFTPFLQQAGLTVTENKISQYDN